MNDPLQFETKKVRIWDAWIRLFHWSLALAVIFLIISGETGWLFFEGHRLAGEIVLALIVFRLIWSVVGSSNASLLVLFASPRSVFLHVRSLIRGDVPSELGHSASGGWAVLFMLTIVGFQAVSGIFIADQDEMLEGAFYGSLSSDTSALLLKLHYWNADLIQAIVLLHIFVIVFYAWRAGKNLVTPMITGFIRWPSEEPMESQRFSHWWIGLALTVVTLSFFSWILSWW